MIYMCTTDLFMERGKQCFTKGKEYEGEHVESVPHLGIEEPAIIIDVDDTGTTHYVTGKWINFFTPSI